MEDIIKSIEKNLESIEEILEFLEEFDGKYINLEEDFVIKYTDFRTLEEFSQKSPVDLEEKEYEELPEKKKKELDNWINKKTEFNNFRKLMKKQTFIKIKKYTE
jgi:hypothetical protein